MESDSFYAWRDTAWAMSQENVEIVRSIYADWERGDFSNIDWADADIEFQIPNEQPVRGVGAMGRRWGEWLRAWDNVAVSPETFHDRGDRVVGVHSFRGQGKRSGIPARDFSVACVFTLRDGKVVRLILYSNKNDALKAAGLRE
jgi:ketosteroid isomerase-like protein